MGIMCTFLVALNNLWHMLHDLCYSIHMYSYACKFFNITFNMTLKLGQCVPFRCISLLVSIKSSFPPPTCQVHCSIDVFVTCSFYEVNIRPIKLRVGVLTAAFPGDWLYITYVETQNHCETHNL